MHTYCAFVYLVVFVCVCVWLCVCVCVYVQYIYEGNCVCVCVCVRVCVMHSHTQMCGRVCVSECVCVHLHMISKDLRSSQNSQIPFLLLMQLFTIVYSLRIQIPLVTASIYVHRLVCVYGLKKDITCLTWTKKFYYRVPPALAKFIGLRYSPCVKSEGKIRSMKPEHFWLRLIGSTSLAGFQA